MKVLLAVFASIFALSSFAGSVTTGNFQTFTTSDSYTEIEGVESSYQLGEGGALLNEGLSFRSEEFTRDDSTITEFDGESYTFRTTFTSGQSNGLIGNSYSESESFTEGYVDSVTYVDNSIEGTYEEASIGGFFFSGGLAYESGEFGQSVESTQYTYQEYETETYSDNSSTYTAW